MKTMLMLMVAACLLAGCQAGGWKEDEPPADAVEAPS